MKVEKDGKTLYHIQSISEYSDEPLDCFVFSNGYPSKECIKEIIKSDFCDADEWIDDIIEGCKVYTVYV